MAALVGHRVRISGLTARTELNGQTGVVESYIPSTNRCVVSVGSGEHVALRPSNIANEVGHQAPGGERAAGMSIPSEILPVAGACGVGLVAFLLGVPLIASFLAAVVVAGVTNAGGLGDSARAALHMASGMIQRHAGVTVAPNHLFAGLALSICLGMYLAHGGASHGYNDYSHQSRWRGAEGHGGGYGGSGYGGYGGGGYGGGYGGGGGFSLYWYLAAFMLGSTVWRFGGGSQPEGWSLDRFWHSLSNIDLWQGMMLMNLLQQVFGGGRRRRGMF